MTLSNVAPEHVSRKHSKPKTEIRALTQEALEYLTEKRKLTKETLDSYKVGCTKHGSIAIPFYDEKDQVQLVKFRSATGGMLTLPPNKDRPEPEEVKTYIEKGGKPVLLGGHLAHPSAGPLVICFGDYDAMSVHQDGVPNCVSPPFGDKGFDFIKLQWDFLEQFSEIVFFTDVDTYPNAEVKARAAAKLEELAQRLGKYRCRIVRNSDRHGTKDANELLIKMGPGYCKAAVDNAEEFPEEGLIRVADYHDAELVAGEPTGFLEIDKNTGGLVRGDLIVIGGDNGAGKTTLILNLVANSVDRQMPVMLWSGEQKVKQIRYWFHRIVAGPKHLKHITANATGFAYYFPIDDYLPFILDWYRDYFFQYKDFSITPEKFFEVAELAVRRYQCSVIIIDNLMAFTGGEGDGYYHAQGDFTQSCKMFAEKWNVVVILIAHNRKKNASMLQKIDVPTKDDIEGAKKITNWADIVLQAYRVPPALKVDQWAMTDGVIALEKCRESGLIGHVYIRHDHESNRIVELSTNGNGFSRAYGWEELYRKAFEGRQI